MSMANSLELRVPFLDKEVFMALAGRIPTRLPGEPAITPSTPCAKRPSAGCPESWAGKKKLGFPVPTRVWLKEAEVLRNLVKAAFQGENGREVLPHGQSWCSYLDDHKAGKADNSRRVWTVYTFLVWYKQFFSEEAVKA